MSDETAVTGNGTQNGNVNGGSDPSKFETTPLDVAPIVGSNATVAIEVIREVSRHILGLGSTAFIFFMLYKFVQMLPDKENVMFLVIGNVTGFLTGIGTWYFGGAMRSALGALRQQKGK